ncbi:MAG: T9SS type A sorting domain-containing protein, partial [Chitinispirillaceae bacterium]|nr:T9SS type A sorting domain-containing protein [Chitinispirillaceae bacterium]
GVAPGGLALTPQETYSVQQISPVSVRPESQRQRSVLPHNVTANVLRTVYDLQGRVIARIPAGKNLTATLQLQSRRGVYIVRTNRQSQSLVVP